MNAPQGAVFAHAGVPRAEAERIIERLREIRPYLDDWHARARDAKPVAVPLDLLGKVTALLDNVADSDTPYADLARNLRVGLEMLLPGE